MLELPDSYVWDFWTAVDEDTVHLFFLYATRDLPHIQDRHHRAAIGHARSTDLTTWERLPDAIRRSEPPAPDDLATWTGSVIQHSDGTWHMFYTGATLTPHGNIQTICAATSDDLTHWTKRPDNPIARADSRWYETLDDGTWREEAFRDPWVMADPEGDGWHLLITARANHGPTDDRGVVGHATSPDLEHWTVQPPLSEPGQGFGHLEVMQYAVVEGRGHLLFSCGGTDLAARNRARDSSSGTWVADAASPLGPFAIDRSQRLADHGLYAGRAVRAPDRNWYLMFFHGADADGRFRGAITNPIPLELDDDKRIAWIGADPTT